MINERLGALCDRCRTIFLHTPMQVCTLIDNGDMHSVTAGVAPWPNSLCAGLEDTKLTPAKDVEVHA